MDRGGFMQWATSMAPGQPMPTAQSNASRLSPTNPFRNGASPSNSSFTAFTPPSPSLNPSPNPQHPVVNASQQLPYPEYRSQAANSGHGQPQNFQQPGMNQGQPQQSWYAEYRGPQQYSGSPQQMMPGQMNGGHPGQWQNGHPGQYPSGQEGQYPNNYALYQANHNGRANGPPNTGNGPGPNTPPNNSHQGPPPSQHPPQHQRHPQPQFYPSRGGVRTGYNSGPVPMPGYQQQPPGGFPNDSDNLNETMASMNIHDHPPAYEEFPAQQEEPEPPGPKLDGIPELNILILGETGVGKSTFINAFVNYVYFRSLDDALSRQGLQCAIPSSFTWQSLVGDDYIAKNINVKPNTGDHNNSQSLQDEQDGTKGQSATQCTKQYTMQIGETLIRLIDTPGIGDTRGAGQDKKNMDDIIASLNSVDVLHGILILLKPNNARLTVMFTFCLKELLTHLHRDAAKNIVFGFTNARNTSFRPGETYTTLKSMLDADRTVGIQLGRNITYCFDSESFRCLAAHYNGVDIHDMGDIQDYRLSWEKSAAETYRMLEHFRPGNTTPHNVRETWDLHRTRELVRILTVPMADITQNINNNIALQKDEQRDLTDALAKGQALETALHLSKVVYEIQALDMPRTVCSHQSCGEFKDNQKHYKSMCHDPCYLDNIEVDQFPCEALMNCYAFSNGTDKCIECGHSWQLHLHILWEPIEKTVQVEDEAVSLRITENKGGVEVMEQALRSRQELIKKYEVERDIIQKAAGQFAVFLKRSSIKPWNDSKLAYLDHLIEEEKGKVEAGGSDKRMKDLQADRRQHAEEIRTLTEYAKAGERDKLLDQEGIKGLINGLYSLELTGPNLKKVAKQLEDIQNSTSDKAKKRSGGGSKGKSHHGHSHGQGQAVRRSGGSGGAGASPSSGPSFANMLANGRRTQNNDPDGGSVSSMFKSFFGH